MIISSGAALRIESKDPSRLVSVDEHWITYDKPPQNIAVDRKRLGESDAEQEQPAETLRPDGARQETSDETYDDHVTAEPSNESYVNDIAA